MQGKDRFVLHRFLKPLVGTVQVSHLELFLECLELFKPAPHSTASRYYGSCSLTRDCEGCLLLTWAGCMRNNGCGWGSILHIVTHVNIYSDIRGAAISSKCAVRVDCCQAGLCFVARWRGDPSLPPPLLRPARWSRGARNSVKLLHTTSAGLDTGALHMLQSAAHVVRIINIYLSK